MVKYDKAITYKKMVFEGIIGLVGYALFVFGQVPTENMVPSMVLWMALLTGVMNYLKNKN